jgi:uncharacterized membrane-anchored protein
VIDAERGATEQHQPRVKLGPAALLVDGWSESPRHERARRHLVWGVKRA